MIDEFEDDKSEQEQIVWAPQPGGQEMLVHCPVTLVGFGGSRGGGKLLSLDEMLPTPTGFVRLADLKTGDNLFDENGQICTVLELHPINNEPVSYRIFFDDDSFVDCCEDHLWLTYNKKERRDLIKRTEEFRAKRRANRPSRAKSSPDNLGAQLTIIRHNKTKIHAYLPPPSGTVRTTKEILGSLRCGKEVNHAIPVTKSLNLPDKKLPIRPYVLGAWLGDGHKHSGALTGIDPEIWREIQNEGYHVTHGLKDKQYHNITGLAAILKANNLYCNKHIPMEYLRSSEGQRLALLQGLMDTDGTVSDSGSAEFCNTNKQIIDGVYDLICSLGWKAKIKEGRSKLNGVDKGPKWTIKWTPSKIVFRLPRKAAKQRLAKGWTTKWRYIVAIQPIPSVPMRCIKVNSPRNLFLVSKSYIPTHNTDGVLGKFAIDQERLGEDFNAIFFRKELPQADDLIERAKQIYMPLGAHWQDQKKQFTFRTGGRLRFRPLANDDDAQKFQGQNLHAAAIEEAGNYSDPSPIWKLFGALRGKGGGQIILTFNPGGSGHHWLKEMFIKPWPQGKKILYKELPNGKKFDYIYLPSRVYDNQILLSKDPTYIDRLHMVGSPELVRAWLEGDFEIHEGSYFPEFSSRHIIAPFNIPKHWPRYLGYDWGYRSPFAAVWGAVSSGKDDKGKEVPYPKGSIIIYREAWGKGVDNVAQADKIASLSVGEHPTAVADPSIFAHEGGPSINDQFSQVFAKYKHPNFRAADNDRISGWAQIRQRLIAKPALLYIFASCPYLIETLPALTIDKRKAEDADSSGNDHACFVGNTKILTDTGAVTIEALAKLNTFNVLTHTGQFTQAVAQLTQKAAKVIKLKFEDGSEVVCTPEHKFHNGDDWEVASKLTEIVTADGKNKKISSIEKLEDRQDVFCLFVPKTNTFVLDNGAVVHNCDALRYLCKERLIESPWEPPKQVYNKGRVQLQAYVEMVRRQTRKARI